MIKFYKFAWKRFNRKAKLCFLLNFLTSFVNNCSIVLIPILQKKMIELMTNSQLEIFYAGWREFSRLLQNLFC